MNNLQVWCQHTLMKNMYVKILLFRGFLLLFLLKSAQDLLHPPSGTVVDIFKSWKVTFQSSAQSTFKPSKEHLFLLLPFWRVCWFFKQYLLFWLFLRHCNLKTNSTVNIVLFYVCGKTDMKGAICFCVSIPLEPTGISSLGASSDQLPQHSLSCTRMSWPSFPHNLVPLFLSNQNEKLRIKQMYEQIKNTIIQQVFWKDEFQGPIPILWLFSLSPQSSAIWQELGEPSSCFQSPATTRIFLYPPFQQAAEQNSPGLMSVARQG